MEEEQKLGHVYRIKSLKGPEVYIGSTVLSLKKRMEIHKSQYTMWLKNNRAKKTCASYHMFDKYGFDGCVAELVQVVPYHQRTEVRRIEEEWMKNTPYAVNLIRAKITEEEHRNAMKEWREKNKEYNHNYLRQKIMCECGKEIGYTTKYYHLKSKIHQRLLEAKKSLPEEEKGNENDGKDEAKTEASCSGNSSSEKIQKPIHVKCGCGISVRRREFSSHKKTMAHLIWMQAEKSKALLAKKDEVSM
jgi:hypothetical protein